MAQKLDVRLKMRCEEFYVRNYEDNIHPTKFCVWTFLNFFQLCPDKGRAEGPTDTMRYLEIQNLILMIMKQIFNIIQS